MRAVNREDLAWLAGFFDGEGCVSVSQRDRKQGSYSALRLQITQCDRAPLDKTKSILGFGNVNGPYPSFSHHKSATRKAGKLKWSYNTSGFERVQATIAMMWPWLGEQKKRQYMNNLQMLG